MADQGAVEVCETFASIQGESTYAGLTCFFIRLAGCNLCCTYCDTLHARSDGHTAPVDDLVRACLAHNTAIAEITGGEPLLQESFPGLAAQLRDETGRPVLVETNGSCDISLVPDGVTTVMDIKTPGSGMAHAMDMKNVGRLRSGDEVKFVLMDRGDYEWSRDLVLAHDLAMICGAVHFSPVSGRVGRAELAEWILADRLPVRLQLQLHKIIDMR